jgi:S-adenosylmethionine:tRNA ribosyltransferase-isomerase
VKTSDFDYALPQELIAQVPAPQRDKSRLLVVDRLQKTISHKHFVDLPDYLNPGDVLVMNNSRVIPARLRARNSKTGGSFEILLLEEVGTNDWWAMMRPGKRARVGTELQILDKSQNPTGFSANVLDMNSEGHRRLQFFGASDLLAELDHFGEVPLPPYIERIAANTADNERYQTIYAEPAGSVAAPTAGLHFTTELLGKIRERGVKTFFVTLHVGPGTFAPVKTESLDEHVMHYERYVIPAETSNAVSKAKATGRRVIAVGTTSVRVLEGSNGEQSGRTNIFIHPPRQFNRVDALITNFHLPRSTLLMLVSAFADPGRTRGRELILRAYEEAIARRYRFFSYGDAMLIV